MTKAKSLGQIEYPRIEIKSFNGSSGEIVLKVYDGADKRVFVKMSIHQVAQLTDIAHALIEKYQEHINFEQIQCKRLKERSTYRGT